jgi:hypothetical protein
LTDQVICRSDNEYAGRPVALYWQGQRLEVEKVLAQWRVPEGKCFRVSALGQVFELVYHDASDDWLIVQR